MNELTERTAAASRPAPEKPDRADGCEEKAEIGPEERHSAARKKPGQDVGEPGTEEETDEHGRGASVCNGYETEKPPAKLIAQINGQAEVEKS